MKDGETVGSARCSAMLAEGAAGKAAPINAGPEKPQPRAEPKAEAQPAKRPRPRRRRRDADDDAEQARRPTRDDAARAVGRAS